MFKKLVSSLPYSPSTIDQVNFYAKRLKKEESIRKLGLFFVVLSMVIQMIAVNFPAERSLAASNNDVINGGVNTIGELKAKYNAHADVKALYNRFGINSSDLDANSAKNESFAFKEQGASGTRTVGRINFASTKDHNLGSFAGSTFYSRSASEWSGSSPAYSFGVHKGTDNNYYKVWVLKDCGNIAYNRVESPSKPTPIPSPKPTPSPSPSPSPTPITPAVSCVRLTADKTTGKKSITVRFNGEYAANQSYLVNGLTFDFGDGTVTRHNGPLIDHTYVNNGTQPKTFTAKLTVNSTQGDKTAASCITTIKVLPEVCAINPNIKPDDPKCGVCTYNANLTPDDPRCKPTPVCVNDPSLKPDDPKCKCIENPSYTALDPRCTTPGKVKDARNVTQQLSAPLTLTTKAKGGDVIEYSLTTTNSNIVPKTNVKIEDYVGDILDYSTIDQEFLKQQGGIFNASTKMVSWDNQKIPANGKLVKAFRVIMKNPIPSTNSPNATATDFDCKMQNGYGNELSIPVECPVLKQAEQLPNTGPGTTLFFAFTVTMISSYFFARSWLLNKELGIIRKEYQHSA